MKVLLLSSLLLVTACATSPTPMRGTPLALDTDTGHTLVHAREELQSALASGDRAALERLLDEGFVFVHSTGRLEQRPDFIDRVVAAAGSGRAPEIEFIDNDIRLYGDGTAVWITHSRRKGGGLQFVGTDVLVRQGGAWRWVSVQSSRMDGPERPPEPADAPVR
jgi:hypothetical protein